MVTPDFPRASGAAGIDGAVFYFAYANRQARDTKAGEGKLVDVSFEESGAVKTLALLGTTGQFVILYDADAERVDIHPIESVHSISFQAD